MNELMVHLPADVQKASDELIKTICSTECYSDFLKAKAVALSTQENRALLQRYEEIQWIIRSLPDSTEPDTDLRHEFEKMNLILFDDQLLSDYLLSKLRLENLTGAVAERILRLSESEHSVSDR